MKLHLGCGKRNIPGFTNVDLADFPHIHHKQSINNLSIFSDESAELIYASHVLEYFDRVEVLSVLKEWRRVLKVGGVLRLAVPDFEQLVNVYRTYGELGKIIGPLYGRWPVPGTDTVLYHKTTYDFSDLKQVLENCGFDDVVRYDWRETIHKDFDDHSQAYIPHMDKEHGALISLNVEAVKKHI